MMAKPSLWKMFRESVFARPAGVAKLALTLLIALWTTGCGTEAGNPGDEDDKENPGGKQTQTTRDTGYQPEETAAKAPATKETLSTGTPETSTDRGTSSAPAGGAPQIPPCHVESESKVGVGVGDVARFKVTISNLANVAPIVTINAPSGKSVSANEIELDAAAGPLGNYIAVVALEGYQTCQLVVTVDKTGFHYTSTVRLQK